MNRKTYQLLHGTIHITVSKKWLSFYVFKSSQDKIFFLLEKEFELNLMMLGNTRSMKVSSWEVRDESAQPKREREGKGGGGDTEGCLILVEMWLVPWLCGGIDTHPLQTLLLQFFVVYSWMVLAPSIGMFCCRYDGTTPKKIKVNFHGIKDLRFMLLNYYLHITLLIYSFNQRFH